MQVSDWRTGEFQGCEDDVIVLTPWPEAPPVLLNGGSPHEVGTYNRGVAGVYICAGSSALGSPNINAGCWGRLWTGVVKHALWSAIGPFIAPEALCEASICCSALPDDAALAELIPISLHLSLCDKSARLALGSEVVLMGGGHATAGHAKRGR